MKKKQLPLAFWIFVGLVAGIAAGLALIPIQIGGILHGIGNHFSRESIHCGRNNTVNGNKLEFVAQ